MKADLAATLGASLLTGGLQIALVPIYVGMMGVEAYGLVGLQMTLIGLAHVFEFGITTTLNRVMASNRDQPQKAHAIFRVLEALYLAIGVLIALALLTASSWLAYSWLSPASLPKGAVYTAITVMGVPIFAQWMCNLYLAGLNGQERFRLAAGIKVCAAVANHGGCLVALAVTDGSLTAFLAWQGAVILVIAATYRWNVIRGLERSPEPLRLQTLRGHWRFTREMGFIGITAVLITHLDKLVLSRLLSLEDFGHYTLAISVVGGLSLIVAPIFNITLPRLTALVQTGNHEEITACYLQRSQLMAWLVFPTAAVIIFAAHPLLLAWSGNKQLAESISPLVSLIALGTTANAMMFVPYSLQLAYSRTRLAIALNLLMLAVLLPGLFFAVPKWGAAGGAVIWAICNGVYLLVGLPLTHGKLLPGENRRWCAAVLPVAVAATILPLTSTMLWTPASDNPRWFFIAYSAALTLGTLTLAGCFARRLFPKGLFVTVWAIVSRR